MQTGTRFSFLESAETHPTKHKSAVRRGSLGHILVCVDHSQFAKVALQQAASLARTFDSALTLLYVLQAPHETDGPYPTDALAWDIATRQAATYLETLKQETTKDSGIVVDSRLEQGHPAERIASLTSELGADLVVLGGHGDNGLPAWNLGSTAEHVLAVARRSVLIARPQSAPQQTWVPKRILVPLDGSLRTESVLPVAGRLARAHGAEVLLAHVIAEPSVTAILRDEVDLTLARDLATRLEGHAARYLGGLRDQLRRDGIDARTIVLRRGDERQVLLDLARTQEADLVVLSAHGSTCNPAWPFGSVTTHMVAHSQIPILVMQDVPESESRHRQDPGDETYTHQRAIFTEAQT
jgi:nucleotide-binding universal stress UspA family protein